MMVPLINRWRSGWYFLATFFPVQLFLLHLRRSHLLIVFWILLFGFVDGFIGRNYGLPYLFLTPEYLDSVSYASYFLVGVTAGLFIVAFHINSYIYYSYRYPFLATLERPLWKFSINNSIIPLLFYGFYLWRVVEFLLTEESGLSTILIRIAGLIAGTVLTVLFTFTYFLSTIRTLEVPEEKRWRKITDSTLRSIGGIIKGARGKKSETATINYYMRTPFSLNLTRHTSHYRPEVLMKTIEQHHLSASLYFAALILLVLGLSLFNDYQVLMIPAGASVFLTFSLYLMVVGAFYTRLKTWTETAGIFLLLLVNYLSGTGPFRSINYAYGMDYSTEPAPYNYERLNALTTDSILDYDQERELEVLERWKAQTGVQRPKLVIWNVSGGGQRSALWTLKVLQEVDGLSKGKFYRHSHLITGSSGGILGAAFFREVKYRHQTEMNEIDPYDQSLQTRIAQDILNPTCFTLAVNDLFFRLQDVEIGGRLYPLDRGYSFDRKFSKNTFGSLNKTVEEYQQPEAQALMPTMILGPTIVGDGRKLLMSTRGVSHLTFTKPYAGIRKEKEFDGVEYSRFFADQDAGNLQFVTALRLSASFPYITPLVNMPSKPGIQLIDAGVRDNEGFELALRYIYNFREWIKENTSGVVVVQIKANRPDEVPIKDEAVTRLDRITLPIGGVFSSFHNLQVYNKSLLMQLSRDELELPVEVVRFSLFEDEHDVSLSWHLTETEKKRILETFDNDINQEALRSLMSYISKNEKPVTEE